jgi:hypothetical protein
MSAPFNKNKSMQKNNNFVVTLGVSFFTVVGITAAILMWSSLFIG